MIRKLLTASVAALLAGTAYAADNSSNPTQAPIAGTHASPGGTARPDSLGPPANVSARPGATKSTNVPGHDSSNPTQAPSSGTSDSPGHVGRPDNAGAKQ